MAADLSKSTSDDSHLAGDSKQSENKHFAGVTEGTSDDTQLADDNKRQENAGGYSGDAPPVLEECRIANDGSAYTFCQFLEHYGKEWGTSMWSEAKDTPPPAPPPQKIVDAAAVNTLLTGTRRWSAAKSTPAPAASGDSATSGAHFVASQPPGPNATEPAAVNTLLTPRTAEGIRRSSRIAGTCKKDMRAFLDATSKSQPLNPEVLAFDIPAHVSWKHYIAKHADCQRIVGSGITKAQLMFFPEIRDANRGGQPRLDFVFENLEGVRCQLHPGNKGKDATPIFNQL